MLGSSYATWKFQDSTLLVVLVLLIEEKKKLPFCIYLSVNIPVYERGVWS